MWQTILDLMGSEIVVVTFSLNFCLVAEINIFHDDKTQLRICSEQICLFFISQQHQYRKAQSRVENLFRTDSFIFLFLSNINTGKRSREFVPERILFLNNIKSCSLTVLFNMVFITQSTLVLFSMVFITQSTTQY
jgi:hypothetical protein